MLDEDKLYLKEIVERVETNPAIIGNLKDLFEKSASAGAQTYAKKKYVKSYGSIMGFIIEYYNDLPNLELGDKDKKFEEKFKKDESTFISEEVYKRFREEGDTYRSLGYWTAVCFGWMSCPQGKTGHYIELEEAHEFHRLVFKGQTVPKGMGFRVLNAPYDFKNKEEAKKKFRELYPSNDDNGSNGPIINPPCKPQKPIIKRDWIDPYNTDAIPFWGREKELEHLDAFAGNGDTADFKIWVIVGPSGSGKTRLTFEWVKRVPIADYWAVLYLSLDVGQERSQAHAPLKRKLVCRDLNQETIAVEGISNDGEDWSTWSPQRPHILIIDHIFGFEEVIRGIVRRAEQSGGLGFPVRLLVLDHRFPESLANLRDDDRWKPLADDGERMAWIKSVFYNDGEPLSLLASLGRPDKPSNENILRHVVRKTVERDLEDHETESALRREVDEASLDGAINYLRSQSQAEYPLFAALVGDAIRRNQDYSRWNRRDLANYYLSGSARLPWENRTLDEKESYWASSLVCAATALGDYPVSQFRDWRPGKNRSKPADIRPILGICERVISREIQADIMAFVPNFVGETFFLTYMRNIIQRQNEFTAFCQILSRGSVEQQSNGAINFVSFLESLTDNLLYDDQKISETKQYWLALTYFLKPNNLKKSTHIRWAISVSIFRLTQKLENLIEYIDVRIGKDSNPIKEIEYILPELKSQVEFDRLMPDFETSDNVLFSATQVSIQYYYKYMNNEDGVKRLAGKLMKHDHKNFPLSILQIVLYQGFANLAIKLISLECDLTRTSYNKWTALMVACRYNQEKVALKIIDLTDHFEDQNDTDSTALMIACRYGQETVALALIEKTKDFDLQDDEGWTALMLALRFNQERAALAMVGRVKKIDQRNANNWNALMFACRYKKDRSALAIIDLMERFDQQNKSGCTALMLACRHAQEPVAMALIDRMKRLDQQDNEQVTALMTACLSRRPVLTRALISKGADVSIQADDGRTALHAASVGGDADCVMCLLAHPDIDLDAVWKIGSEEFTALAVAEHQSHTDVVNLIRDAMARKAELPPQA